MTSLNPSMRIGQQLDEGLALHGGIGRRERKARILDMLGRVGIADGERALSAYPHEFSGGMRQHHDRQRHADATGTAGGG
ncbi:hypothetical protein HK436_05050 [Mesorhizobium sediminum]|nr:hypothetical protein [Mesorhizobium sediminum]